MKLRLGFIVISILISFAAMSQTLHSRIIDEDGEAVAHAHIKIAKYHLGSITNNNGHFWINYSFEFPLEIEISHIAYEKRTITIDKISDLPNAIQLNIKSISGIIIKSNPVINLIPEKKLYVYDYTMLSDTLVLLCFSEKKINERYIVLIDKEGEEMSRYTIPRAQQINVDPLGDLYYCTGRQLIYIQLNKGFVQETKRYSKQDYLSTLEQVSTIDKSTIFAKKYFDNDQILVHFLFEKDYMEVNEITEILNEQAIDRMNDPHSLLMSSKMTEHDLRFEKMCFYAPIYAPLFISNQQVVILNFTDQLIEKYDLQGNKLSFLEMDESFSIPQRIIQDAITKKLYAYYESAGKSIIKLIDLEHASLEDAVSIPAYAFIEKVDIAGSELFFLYKENASDDYKKIYKMPIY